MTQQPEVSAELLRGSMGNNRDPRAERTRSRLIAAFNEMVSDSDPKEISISSLTTRAGTNRTTFYAHFADIDDLAEYALRQAFDSLGAADLTLRDIGSASTREATEFALTKVVQYFDQRKESFRSLIGPGTRFPTAVHTVVFDNTLRTIQTLPDDARGQIDPQMLAHYVSNALLGTISAWIREEIRCDTSQLVEQFMLAFPPILTQNNHPATEVRIQSTR